MTIYYMNLPEDRIVPSLLNARAWIDAVCAGGKAAAGAPVAISHIISSPQAPAEASHRPHTENATVNTDC